MDSCYIGQQNFMHKEHSLAIIPALNLQVDEDIDDSNESDFSEAAEVDVFGDGEHVEAIRRNLRDVYDRYGLLVESFLKN